MLDSLLAAVRSVVRVLSGRPALLTGEGDPQAAESIRRAREAQADGHVDEARTLYRYVLQRWTTKHRQMTSSSRKRPQKEPYFRIPR